MSAVAESKGIKIVAKNSKAHHDYFIEEKYEAGIELAGTEVKSIRQGHVNLKDSFCIVKDGQMSVIGMHISPYEKGNIFNKDPLRQRRLLMHKREILKLFARIKQDGYSLIPLSIYFRGPRVKLEIGPEGRQAGNGPGHEVPEQPVLTENLSRAARPPVEKEYFPWHRIPSSPLRWRTAAS